MFRRTLEQESNLSDDDGSISDTVEEIQLVDSRELPSNSATPEQKMPDDRLFAKPKYGMRDKIELGQG